MAWPLGVELGQPHAGSSGQLPDQGSWGHSGHAGQGYITEAVAGITRWAFDELGMRRIEALPDDLNHASCRVCERAGYTLEGVHRHDRIAPDGTLRNTRVYAVVR